MNPFAAQNKLPWGWQYRCVNTPWMVTLNCHTSKSVALQWGVAWISTCDQTCLSCTSNTSHSMLPNRCTAKAEHMQHLVENQTTSPCRIAVAPSRTHCVPPGESKSSSLVAQLERYTEFGARTNPTTHPRSQATAPPDQPYGLPKYIYIYIYIHKPP